MINAKLMVMTMRKLGYELLVASNGVEALELLEREAKRGPQHEIQCILMDSSMDLMDGLEWSVESSRVESSRVVGVWQRRRHSENSAARGRSTVHCSARLCAAVRSFVSASCSLRRCSIVSLCFAALCVAFVRVRCVSTRRIRAAQQADRVRPFVIAQTAHVTEEYQQLCADAGMVAHTEALTHTDTNALT